MSELEVHQQEVDALNLELRQQVAERSRDLADLLGDEYRRYRARTPMFVPRVGSTGRGAQAATASR